MEKNPLLATQVFAITNIEQFISVFHNDPEYNLKKIIELIDEHKIAEHKEIMNYLYDLFVYKGYLEYAEIFAKKYNIQTEKT